MKKMLRFSVLLLVVGLVLGFTGCPTDDKGGGGGVYDEYYDGNFRSNRNGTVEVVNNTASDMLLFEGEIIGVNYIVGGVKSGTRNTINFSTKTDYQVGGYVLLRAVKQSEFDIHKNQSRIDHTAMVTYGEGKKFTTNIVSTTDGAYQYTVYNRSRDYGLELRKNSPEGEKIAYLTKGEVRRVIQSPNRDELTLYPVWVAFNNVTKSIVTFTPNETLSALDIQPKQPTEDVSPYYFPLGGTTANIIFPDVNLPFATIQVRNNATLNANFRVANTVRTPESGYTGITSGARESYEIRAVGNDSLNLNLAMSQGSIVVPVRFESDPGANGVIIENGYSYTVVLNLKNGADPALAASYEAWLSAGTKMNTSDLLISQ
jgi:hypothetical protein